LLLKRIANFTHLMSNFYSNIQQRLEQAARAGLNQAGIVTQNQELSDEFTNGASQERIPGPMESTPEEFERLRKLEGRFVGKFLIDKILLVPTRLSSPSRTILNKLYFQAHL
jgi:hypothetical protein